LALVLILGEELLERLALSTQERKLLAEYQNESQLDSSESKP
jgi:hypothetical protein